MVSISVKEAAGSLSHPERGLQLCSVKSKSLLSCHRCLIEECEKPSFDSHLHVYKMMLILINSHPDSDISWPTSLAIGEMLVVYMPWTHFKHYNAHAKKWQTTDKTELKTEQDWQELFSCERLDNMCAFVAWQPESSTCMPLILTPA